MVKQRVLMVVAVVGLALVMGCGGGGGAPTLLDPIGTADEAGTPDTGGPDTSVPDLGPGEEGIAVDIEDHGFDTQPTPDVPVDEGSVPVECPGGVGCSCSGPNDCYNGLCVETMEGYVCTNTCAEEGDCPKGWKCVLVQGLGGDAVYACVDPGSRLCRPCKSNQDCRPSVGATETAVYLCIDFGPTGSFCGLPCSGDTTCPADFVCKSVPAGTISIDQCLPASGECPCTKKYISEGAKTACYIENEHGKCFGERTCDTPCNAKTPAPEECNGLDDDCNGSTDDKIPQTPCPLSNEHGTCTGTSKCVAGQLLCEGAYASPESCNGADDDCDGQVDDGFNDIDKDGVADCVDSDRDGDTIPNNQDNCPDVSNPDQKDSEGDGTGDACDSDDDNDGIPDLTDNCPFTANLDQKDFDKDGQGDACDCDADNDGVMDMKPGCVCSPCDNCPLGYNPGQSDNDKDGLGDECDPDIDGDLIPNETDNCPTVPNYDQNDLDLDKIGDACDSDDDGDGVPDTSDNCPVVPNSGQGDVDGDGTGDECDCDIDGDGVSNPGVGKTGLPCPTCSPCDNCPRVPNSNQADDNHNGIGDACEDDWDGDGISNAVDNCPWQANPDQLDIDNDKIGDVCDCDIDQDGVPNPNPGCPAPQKPDNCPSVPNSNQADLDQDGLGDSCDPDIDGDGTPNQADCAPMDPSISPTMSERCNGKDDNCNNFIDELWPQLSTPCDGPDRDKCEEGTWVCKADGGGIECSDTTANNQEKCNELDDDCDGDTDEDFSTKGQACDGADDDLCAEGVFVCKSDGSGVVCNDTTLGNVELCNNIDDDCDGQTDETFPMKGQSCDGDDEDFCKEGTFVCSSDLQGLICTDTSPTNIELCNDKDDDCDGLTDETFPQKGQSCDGPDADLCNEGVLICGASGYDLVCTDTTATNPEYCNEKDDDCDGATDEDFPLKGQTCDGDDADFCKEGTWVCSASGTALTCNDSTPDNPEVCNDLDDDCDGLTDETFPQKGSPCDGPDPDDCAGGYLACNARGNGLVCVGDDVPSLEVCNNKDDDCDGLVDENWPNKGLPCDGADGDLCEEGVWKCKADGTGLECGDTTGTNIEQCNDADDDCDGQTDETWPELGKPCDGADSDLCKEGVWVCNALQTGVDCTDTSGNDIEVCNAQDDDCDGQTDEGTGVELCGAVPNATPLCSAGQCLLVCDAGWYDIDAAFASGCECQEDANDSQNNLCSTAVDLGVFNDQQDGVKTFRVAGIVKAGDEDWYKVVYQDLGDSGTPKNPYNETFHLRIRLEYPTDGTLRLEVFRNTCNTKATCGNGNENNPGTTFEHAVDYRGDCVGAGHAPCGERPCYTTVGGGGHWECKPGDQCCESGDPAPAECRTLKPFNKCQNQGDTFYIRVFRASGYPTECSQTQYKLVIENI